MEKRVLHIGSTVKGWIGWESRLEFISMMKKIEEYGTECRGYGMHEYGVTVFRGCDIDVKEE